MRAPLKTLFKLLSLFVGLSAVILPKQALSQIAAKIEHYSTEDGLSHDIISTMFKDHEGYMWFGTWYGLNRFDGNHFTSYRSLAGDSSQIKNNRIDYITEDESGQLWLKAYDGQIYRFNKATEQFRALTVILALTEKVTFDRILSAKNGELWVSVANGGVIVIPDVARSPNVYYWYKKNGDLKHHIPSNKITSFLRDQGGNIWLGTTAGLIRFPHKKYDRPELIPGDDGKLLFTTAVETKDQLFFASDAGFLVAYQKSKGAFANIRVSTTAINYLLVSIDQKKLYITTAAGELILCDLQSKALQRYLSPDKLPLRSIFEDHHGNIWVEPDKKGIFRVDKLGRLRTTAK